MGITLLIAGTTSLVLALELGNSQYGWSNSRTLGSFVAAGILIIAFAAEQWWMGDKALLPPRIIGMRVVLFSSLFSFCLESAFLTLVYYVSISSHEFACTFE